MRRSRSKRIKLLNCLCSLVILGSVMAAVFVGMNIYALGVLTIAVASIATPVIIGGEGILDMLVGVLEAVLDGVLVLVEAIGHIFD